MIFGLGPGIRKPEIGVHSLPPQSTYPAIQGDHIGEGVAVGVRADDSGTPTPLGGCFLLGVSFLPGRPQCPGALGCVLELVPQFGIEQGLGDLDSSQLAPMLSGDHFGASGIDHLAVLALEKADLSAKIAPAPPMVVTGPRPVLEGGGRGPGFYPSGSSDDCCGKGLCLAARVT